MVIVDLMLALICFNGACYPALVGHGTPKGEYQLEHRATAQPGYNGDVLVFLETKDLTFAVHRVYMLNAWQHRDKRIESPLVKDRIMTNGCINVSSDVYEKLVDCCSTDKIKIE